MNMRLLLSASAATGLAMCGTSAAMAQQAAPVQYEPVPVVEPLPARMRDAGADYRIPESGQPAMYRESYDRSPYPAAPSPAYETAGDPRYGYTRTPIEFDRDGWLADCRRQYGEGKKKGGILGSLLGAIAGGVVGNRVADSERLAGTLIGAGVGGLAGLAIGSAIGSSGERRRTDECEATLDRYLAGGYGPEYAGYPGYGHARAGYGRQDECQCGYADYGYRQPMRMIPVSVPVQQRAVIREYVTYETYMDTETTVRPAQPVSRVRYIKDRPAPTPVKRVPVPRSVKGQ